MKNVLLVFGVLLLAACAPAQQVAPTTDTTPKPTAPTQPETLPEPVVQAPDQTKTRLDNLPTNEQEIIENAPERTADGIRYQYTKLENTQLATDKANQATIYQRGSTVKIQLVNPKVYDRATYVDVIILDTAAKTAQGYCYKISVCGSDVPVKRSAKYSDYAFPLPLSWYESMEDVQSVPGETLGGRLTYKLSATVDGVATLIWIDRYSGTPLQVKQGSTTYKYENLALGVSDEELEP